MAQKVQVLLFDDIDGSAATETIQFGLDGARLEIDLNEGNASNLRSALRQYIEFARPVSTRRQSHHKIGSRADAGTMRAWLIDNGYQQFLKDKGRVPNWLQDAHTDKVPYANHPLNADLAALPQARAVVVEPPAVAEVTESEPPKETTEPVAAAPAKKPASRRQATAASKPAAAKTPAAKTTATKPTPRQKAKTAG
jgi:hypothetical protein